MPDPTAALLEAMRRAWPSHTEGSGGTNTASTFWQVLDPTLPSEGLAAAILAALPPGSFPPDSLDAAWAEAEAALPKGKILRVEHDPSITDLPSMAEVIEYDDWTMAHIDAETPAAALRALAAKLREVK